MFSQYFRPLNCVCNIFAVSKPHITAEGKSVPTHFLVKIWCLVIAAVFIASYPLSITVTEFKLKDDLQLISDINDMAANVGIIFMNLVNGRKVCVNIHKTLDAIFQDFNFEHATLKLMAIKIYLWFATPLIMFLSLIILEMYMKVPPYDLITRAPIFISLMYLFIHLYLILALLKVVNTKLSKTITLNDIKTYDDEEESSIKYFLSPSIRFTKLDNHIHSDLKLLCKIYDNLSTCVHLLEQSHGCEILIAIWLMFTNGVVGMTLIVHNQASIKWLVYVKSVLPFFWAFIGCCIYEQLNAEVETTITLLIKCLIDYRCVTTMKPSLETFKQLVSNDRLQFTACNLFHLTYAMLLGTILNVITYSIILIQMFVN